MLPRRAARHRSAPRSGRWGRLGDAGQATLEHTGLAVLVGAVVLALVAVPVGPRLAEALRLVVCQITGGGCAAADPRAPQCLLSSRGESVARTLTVGAVVGGSGGGSQGSTVETLGDGSVNLITDTGVQAGVEVALAADGKGGGEGKSKGKGNSKDKDEGKSKEEGAGGTEEGGGGKGRGAENASEGYGEGRSGGGVDIGGAAAEAGLTTTGTVHAVRRFASAAEKDDYVRDHTGAGQSAVDVVGNVAGSGTGDALDSVLRRAGLKQEDPHPPDAYRDEVENRFDADAVASALGSAEARAGLHGGGTGTLEREADGSSVTLSGRGDVSAMAGAGFLEHGGSREGIASAGYAITYDRGTEPTNLVLTTDVENTGARGAEAGREAITADGSLSSGTAETRTWSMPLETTDRELLRRATPALVGGVGTPADATRALAALRQRMARNAVESRATWDVAASRETKDRGPALGIKARLTHVTTTDDRELRTMLYRDHAQADQTWKGVPSCG